MFWRKRRKPKPKPAKVKVTQPKSLTDGLVISMLADGMTYDEIKQILPDFPEEQLKKTVKKACDNLGLFPDLPP